MKNVLFYKKSNLIGSAGGVEKVLVTLSNALAQKGYAVYLTTRDKKEGTPFFAVSSQVKFHRFQIKFSSFRRFLGKIGFSFFSYFNRELLISKNIQKYINENKIDVIITAGIQDMGDILYSSSLPQKKVVMLHSRPDVYFTKKKEKYFIDILKKVDLVQVLLPSFVPIIQKYYQGPVEVIGNAISLNAFTNKREKIIIYPARIEKDKQQHLLIEAFSKISAIFPDWKIHFRGGVADTEYFNVLNGLVEKYNLQKQVVFLKPTPNLDIEFSKCSLCAFPSKYEGFPLGLCEAMASGLPVIGFQTASGVCDLILPNENGFLASDVDDFSLKIKILLEDDALRMRLGENAKNIALTYNEKIIISKWMEVINA